jgi:hypothetical protein
MAFDLASSTDGCTLASTGRVTCTNAILANETSREITVGLRLSENASCTDVIGIHAGLASPDSDPNGENNTKDFETTPDCTPQVCTQISWTEAGANALPTDLTNASTVSFGNQILEIGGYNMVTHSTRTVYRSSNGNTWTSVGNNPLPIGLHHASAVVLGESIFLIGGANEPANAPLTISNTVYRSTNGGVSWTAIGQLPMRVGGHASVTFNNKIYVIGGDMPSNTGHRYLDTVYSSPDGIIWTLVGHLPKTVAFPVAGVINGTIVVTGGISDASGASTQNEIFTSTDGGVTWGRLPSNPIPENLVGAAMMQFDGALWLIGGNYADEVYRSTDGRHWQLAPQSNLPVGMVNHTAAVLGTHIYAIGGNVSTAPHTSRKVFEGTCTAHAPVAAHGNLFVTKDSTPVRSRQLLGGAAPETIAQLLLRADAIEDIDVHDLQFTSVGGLAHAIDRLELYKEGASSYFGLATIGSCAFDQVPTRDPEDRPAQTFCSKLLGQQLVVPKGTEERIIVKARLKTDVDGATSADPIQVYISGEAVSNNMTGRGAVRAAGVLSGELPANNNNGVANGEIFIGSNVVTGNNSSIVHQKHVSAMSKVLTLRKWLGSDADGSNVPTGAADIANFEFITAPHSNSKDGLNDVVLRKILFTVESSNVAMAGNGFAFFNTINPMEGAPCTAIAHNGTPITETASGNFHVRCELDGTGVNAELDPNTNTRFFLRATITNTHMVASQSSNLRVQLRNFTNINATTFGTGEEHSHIQWNDRDNSTNATFLWMDYPETVIYGPQYQS